MRSMRPRTHHFAPRCASRPLTAPLPPPRIHRRRYFGALCAETHEAWLEDNRYINMDLLREQRKEQLGKVT